VSIQQAVNYDDLLILTEPVQGAADDIVRARTDLNGIYSEVGHKFFQMLMKDPSTEDAKAMRTLFESLRSNPEKAGGEILALLRKGKLADLYMLLSQGI